MIIWLTFISSVDCKYAEIEDKIENNDAQTTKSTHSIAETIVSCTYIYVGLYGQSENRPKILW